MYFMVEKDSKPTRKMTVEELEVALGKAMLSEDHAVRRMILQPHSTDAQTAQQRAINRQRQLRQRLNDLRNPQRSKPKS
jgi:hypothetical protein